MTEEMQAAEKTLLPQRSESEIRAFLEERVRAVRETLQRESEPLYPAPRLIAVTKTVGPEMILPLKELGVEEIAENRVQVLEEKLPAIGSANFRIHLIGRLQRNKVKYIIKDVCMIHSADNMPLLQEIDRQAQKNGLVMPVLVQVNIAGETQKGGVPPEEVLPLIREGAKLPGVKISGLMTMMPIDASEEEIIPMFREMRRMYEQLQSDAVQGTEIRELSMGMSRDYHLAARCGATMVRVGSALFR